MNEVNAFVSVVSILGILWVIFWPYKSYRVDSFRQQMFRLRDELFDYASEGHLNFSHPAYQMQRDTFNGFIRYAEELSLVNLVFIILFGGRPQNGYRKTFLNHVKTLTTEQKKKVLDVQMRMHKEVGTFVMLRSPFVFVVLMAIAIPLILLALIFGSINYLKKSLKAVFTDIDSIAIRHT